MGRHRWLCRTPRSGHPSPDCRGRIWFLNTPSPCHSLSCPPSAGGERCTVDLRVADVHSVIHFTHDVSCWRPDLPATCRLHGGCDDDSRRSRNIFPLTGWRRSDDLHFVTERIGSRGRVGVGVGSGAISSSRGSAFDHSRIGPGACAIAEPDIFGIPGPWTSDFDGECHLGSHEYMTGTD
jgi:hypothetical protein